MEMNIMELTPIQFHVKGFNRTKSALSVAAYRSGTRLKDYTNKHTYNYTKKQHIVYNEMLFPSNCPEDLKDRETYWNKRQIQEKQITSCYCRELEFALPRDLNEEDRLKVTREFLIDNFQKKGYVVDFSIHCPDAADGLPQPHVHALVDTRKILENGEWEKTKEKKVYKLDENGERIPIIDKETGKQKIGAHGRKMWKRTTIKNNEIGSRDSLLVWRKNWAQTVNKYLPPDHQWTEKSYSELGIDRIPTKHEGYVARKIVKRGGVSWRIEQNKQIRELNRKIQELEKELIELREEQEREQEIEEKEDQKQKLEKEQSEKRASDLVYDLLRKNNVDVMDWVEIYKESSVLASSNRIEGLFDISQDHHNSYIINDYSKTHELPDDKWLTKSLVTIKAGAQTLKNEAEKHINIDDKNKIDDELRKKREEALRKQAPERKPSEGFTAAPQRHDNTAYEFKKALNQIDRGLDNTVEKRRALHDYEATQRAVAREQKRMQDDLDM